MSHGSLASLCRCGVSRLCKCRQVRIVFESAHAGRLSAIRRRSSFGREKKFAIFIGLYEDLGYGGSEVRFCISLWGGGRRVYLCLASCAEVEGVVPESFYFILRMYDDQRWRVR